MITKFGKVILCIKCGSKNLETMTPSCMITNCCYVQCLGCDNIQCETLEWNGSNKMPVNGPYISPSLVESVYGDFLEAIRNRGLLTSRVDRKPGLMFQESRVKLLADLKKLAEEVVWQDACESW